MLEDGVVRTLPWRYRFNRDGGLIGSLSPEGVLTQKLFGREYFDRSIRDAQSLQDEFDVPVLAEIPRIHDAA